MLPITEVRTLKVPLMIDDVALPERGLYEPAEPKDYYEVKVRVSGELRTWLTGSEGEQLDDWTLNHMRLGILLDRNTLATTDTEIPPVKAELWLHGVRYDTNDYRLEEAIPITLRKKQ